MSRRERLIIELPALDGGLFKQTNTEHLEQNQMAGVDGFVRDKTFPRKDFGLTLNSATMDKVRGRSTSQLAKCSWSNPEKREYFGEDDIYPPSTTNYDKGGSGEDYKEETSTGTTAPGGGSNVIGRYKPDKDKDKEVDKYNEQTLTTGKGWGDCMLTVSGRRIVCQGEDLTFSLHPLFATDTASASVSGDASVKSLSSSSLTITANDDGEDGQRVEVTVNLTSGGSCKDFAYILRNCCKGVTVTASPSTITHDDGVNAEVTLNNAKEGCSYVPDSGGAIGTFGATSMTIFAENEPGVYTVKFSNPSGAYCGSEGAECGSCLITVQGSCATSTETIGSSSNQMATSGTQELTVLDPRAGVTYTWAITSGGGSLSAPTGTSVTYTAPSSNANCANNPTITMSCGGVVKDTLEIAVNGYSTVQAGWYGYCKVDKYPYRWSFLCNGGWDSEPFVAICYTTNTPCSASFAHCRALTGPPGDAFIVEGYLDTRNSTLLNGGCCPAQLL